MIKRDFPLDMQSGLHICNWIHASPSHQQAKEKYVILSIDYIIRWHYYNGRQLRGTKESLDAGERGEWKSWLKAQHSKLWSCGEGNGNPPQCSCLENPRDGGAWWAAISGVTKSDTTEATWQQQQQYCGCIPQNGWISNYAQWNNPHNTEYLLCNSVI